MGDNLAELLYMARRAALLSSFPDLPSWGNVRDPEERAAWEAAATAARREMRRQCAAEVAVSLSFAEATDAGAPARAVDCLRETHKRWGGS